jgi:hypothetical protein
MTIAGSNSNYGRGTALRLNYERLFIGHFGVCSSGFSLSFAPFEAIIRIAELRVDSLVDARLTPYD